jgi:hypothetical protein
LAILVSVRLPGIVDKCADNRGDACMVEDALSRGHVSWQGLVHDIDYLDLDDPIKRIVGRWWRKWVKTEGKGSRGAARTDEDDDEDNDAVSHEQGVGGRKRGMMSDRRGWG